MKLLLPEPKQATFRPGQTFTTGLRSRPLAPGDLPRLLPEGAFSLTSPAALPAGCPPAGREEWYSLRVSPDGVEARAVTDEGLLRADSTLLQLVEDGPGGLEIPCCEILDWPDIRFRCASDWLLNCEINRWGYDWGDGPEAYLSRVKRKMEMCYRHKINQIWFDGFGWDIHRTPNYAALMRECSRYARRLGIRLTFAGYGAGYGTSYQSSELYRCGYQGQVFLNQRPWPDGEVYLCRGHHHLEGRQYGSCLSNADLAAGKLTEMLEFVRAIEPGFMYIHDIDADGWEASQVSWQMRCEYCRKRWPSDSIDDPQGMAGAMAEWVREVAEALRQVRTENYAAARDLTLIFISPLYGNCDESDDTWEHEVSYYRLVSRLIGPVPGIEFGIREQSLNRDGSSRVRQLAEALDAVGHGHACHVLAFLGGDNFTSNDLCNVAGAFSPLYLGAESVCLANGGVHEEPVQLLNAECLWNASVPHFAIDTSSVDQIQALWRDLRAGRLRPADAFATGALFNQCCRVLWGEQVGDLMYRAYLCGGESGMGPVSRVWWGVTRDVQALRVNRPGAGRTWEQIAECWRQRSDSTASALALAREAARLSKDEDVHGFARGLEVGGLFARVMAPLLRHRVTSDGTALHETREALRSLRDRLAKIELRPTDILGGDPGCWGETMDALAAIVEGETP